MRLHFHGNAYPFCKTAVLIYCAVQSVFRNGTQSAGSFAALCDPKPYKSNSIAVRSTGCRFLVLTARIFFKFER